MTQKTKREAFIVVVLLGLLIGLMRHAVAPAVRGGQPSVAAPAAPDALATSQPISPPEPRVETPRERPDYTAEAQARRDPMVSLLPSDAASHDATTTVQIPFGEQKPGAPQLPTLLVHGIVWGTARPQALINGGLYEIGDTVEGARIVSIERRGVTVEAGGTRAVLTLAPGPALAKRVVGQGDAWYSESQRR